MIIFASKDLIHNNYHKIIMSEHDDMDEVHPSELLPAMKSACEYAVQSVNEQHMHRALFIQQMVKDMKQQITNLETVVDGFIHDIESMLLYICYLYLIL